MGSQRLKQKINDMRLDYRSILTVYRRSGSGKLLQDHWDHLKNICGGSPPVINLQNSRFSLQIDSSDKKSHTCEEGEAHLRIYFWHLMMNLKNK